MSFPELVGKAYTAQLGRSPLIISTSSRAAGRSSAHSGRALPQTALWRSIEPSWACQADDAAQLLLQIRQTLLAGLISRQESGQGLDEGGGLQESCDLFGKVGL